MSFAAIKEFLCRDRTERHSESVASQMVWRSRLTPSAVCRLMIQLVLRELEPGTLERGQTEPNVVRGDLLQHHVEFEAGNLDLNIDDYLNFMRPHAIGFASLLKMSDAWQVFDLPLPEGRVCCRHTFDGISLRLIVLPGDVFRFDVLFRPRAFQVKPLIEVPRISEKV